MKFYHCAYPKIQYYTTNSVAVRAIFVTKTKTIIIYSRFGKNKNENYSCPVKIK